MLLATVLALSAAVLHASWNFAVKQSTDRRLALWGLFFIAGVLSAIALGLWILVDGMPSISWRWVFLSGVIHVPYVLSLSRAYDRGDFSMAYPIARGGGALLAAFGGVVILRDNLSALSMIGIVVVVAGLLVLAYAGSRPTLIAALTVAATIGAYTLVDAHGARLSDALPYSLALTAVQATITSTWISLTRRSEMISTLRSNWKILTAGAIASTAAYSMVLIAVQYAPVGYVAALRESSVVLAAFAGWRLLDEGDHRRRIFSAGIVLTGLVLLVSGG
ncbi:MAG: EamA family transporter [Ilumatobacteraceae bacterium]